MVRGAFILFLALLVTACGGRSEREVVRRDNDVFRSEPARQCLSTLKAANVRFTPLPNQSFAGGCRTIDTVKLMSFSTEATNLGAMTCPLAANFTAWAKHAVEPAAKAYLGSEVVRIETMGTYNCRNINGGRSGRLSEHASGNAVDVSAFILKMAAGFRYFRGGTARQMSALSCAVCTNRPASALVPFWARITMQRTQTISISTWGNR